MLFMVIEHFKDRNPEPVYKRFAKKGRMLPEGLTYVDSWIELGMDRCFQVMETDDQARLQEWMSKWNDLVDFEVVPVVTSADMQQIFAR